MRTISIESTKIQDRLDVHFYREEFIRTSEELLTSKYELATLKDISILITDGEHGSPQYVEEGALFLTTQNIKEEGIDLTDVKYIPFEKHFKELARSRLHVNDILLTKTGEYCGIATVVPKGLGESNTIAHVARIVPKEGINPYYVAAFLNSRFGRSQTQRIGRKATRREFKLNEIEEIKVPLPPQQIQNKISNIWLETLTRIRSYKEESTKLVALARLIPIQRLGITSPTLEKLKTFAAQSSEVKERLDSAFYQPMYAEVNKVLSRPGSSFRVGRLEEVATFSGETVTPQENPEEQFHYVEISDIDADYGEIVSHTVLKGSEAPSRARMLLKAGQVLLPKLSRTFSKVAIIPEGLHQAVGSTGFFVLSPRNVRTGYLWAILRSEIVQRQLERGTTGAIMPAISEEVARNTLIPVPADNMQASIFHETEETVLSVKRLREMIDEIMQSTKREIEQMLLG